MRRGELWFPSVLSDQPTGSSEIAACSAASSSTTATISVATNGLAMIGRIFKLDMPKTPTLTAILERCSADPAFADAEASRQPGAPTP